MYLQAFRERGDIGYIFTQRCQDICQMPEMYKSRPISKALEQNYIWYIDVAVIELCSILVILAKSSHIWRLSQLKSLLNENESRLIYMTIKNAWYKTQGINGQFLTITPHFRTSSHLKFETDQWANIQGASGLSTVLINARKKTVVKPGQLNMSHHEWQNILCCIIVCVELKINLPWNEAHQNVLQK